MKALAGTEPSIREWVRKVLAGERHRCAPAFEYGELRDAIAAELKRVNRGERT